MAYVALSRLMHLKSLCLRALEPNILCADPLFLSYNDYVQEHGTHRGWRDSVNTIKEVTEAEIRAEVRVYEPPASKGKRGASSAADGSADRADKHGKVE